MSVKQYLTFSLDRSQSLFYLVAQEISQSVASCSSKKHELVENVRLNFNRRVELKQLRQTDRDTGHRNGDWMDQEKVEADRILLWRMG